MATRKKAETAAVEAAPAAADPTQAAVAAPSTAAAGTQEQPAAAPVAAASTDAAAKAPTRPKPRIASDNAGHKALERVKASWLERYEGPHLKLELKLHHPITQRFHKRYFDITSRNAHFVSVFARALLGDDQVKEPEAAIEAKIKGVITHFENMVAGSKAIMADAKHDQMAQATPTKHMVPIVSRNSKQFFDMLAKADEALLYLHTLWLWGEVDDQERSRRELDLKTNLRRAATTVRTICLGLRNRYAKQQEGAANAEAAAAAADLAGEPAELPGEESDAAAEAKEAMKAAA